MKLARRSIEQQEGGPEPVAGRELDPGHQQGGRRKSRRLEGQKDMDSSVTGVTNKDIPSKYSGMF